MLLMTNFIKYYRKKAGITQEDLAEAIDTTHPTLQRIETGKITLSKEWAERIAPVLKVHPINLMFGEEDLIAAQQVSENTATPINVDFEKLPIVGSAEAGVFVDSIEKQEADWSYIRAPIDERYIGKPRFCIEVKGNSMNAEFPSGSLAICIRLNDLDEDISSGSLYVVDQTRLDGKTEITLKELRTIADGRQFLWPRSDDPLFQQPIEYAPHESDSIKLRAKVVGIYAPR